MEAIDYFGRMQTELVEDTTKLADRATWELGKWFQPRRSSDLKSLNRLSSALCREAGKVGRRSDGFSETQRSH